MAKIFKLNQPSFKGFTLIELLVVLALFGILLTLGLLDFARLRGPRDVKQAQARMVTDIRKVQSYALTSRNIPTTGASAKYYIIKFDRTISNVAYEIQAIDNNGNFVPGIETVKFPVDVAYMVTTPNLIINNSAGQLVGYGRCVQVAFSLPFGRIYTDVTIDDGSHTNPCLVNIASHVDDPSYMDSIADRKLEVGFSDLGGSGSKTVFIYGISGKVEGP